MPKYIAKIQVSQHLFTGFKHRDQLSSVPTTRTIKLQIRFKVPMHLIKLLEFKGELVSQLTTLIRFKDRMLTLFGGAEHSIFQIDEIYSNYFFPIYQKFRRGARNLDIRIPKPLKSTLINDWTCKFMFSSVFQENELKVQIDKPCKR